MTDKPKKNPYLLNGIYEWINDCHETPFLVVESRHKGMRIPEHLRQDAPLVLNISMNAVKDLLIDDDGVSFTARFSGEVFEVFIPEMAVYSLVSQETGDGVSIRLSVDLSEESADTKTDGKASKPSRNLKLN